MKKIILALTISCLAVPCCITASDQSRQWDQAKAVEAVNRLIKLEQQGQPWDKIAWETDPEKAVARAREEGKPLFLYIYLKKNVGPAAAPC